MSIEVGSKVQGKVTGITNFGAFVELGNGKTGLVHISEVADNYVKDINDHFSVGDEVTVKIINIENDGKIGLSIKQTKDNPMPERRQARRKQSRPARPDNFEAKMDRFLKDSEERLSTLRKQTESKRGGRGAR